MSMTSARPGLVFALALASVLISGTPAGSGGAERQPDPLPAPLADPAPRPPWGVPDSQAPSVGPSFEEQVLELTNEERWANGQLPPLKGQSLLDSSAATHSTNMGTRNFFAHCDPDTHTLPWDRMTAAGYVWNAAAENIAAGYADPAQVMAAWMASPGHRANILATTYRELGVGYYLDGGDASNVRLDNLPAVSPDCVPDATGGPYFRYWTQNFGRRIDVYPVVIDREAFSTTSQNVDLYLYGAGSATEMRVRNDPGTFTPWMAFSSNLAWQLSAGGGVKTVIAEVRFGAVVRTASDSIFLDQPLGIFSDGFESGDTSAWSVHVP